jgi:hypothetical protein
LGLPEWMQVISLVGALLILSAYFANQVGALSPSRWPYSAINLVGATLLAWVAIDATQYGFIVLEGAWAVISLFGLLRVGLARRRKTTK